MQEPINVRPASQHRHSSTMAGSLPKSRPHSHSQSVGSSINPAHRVTRRKSMVGVPLVEHAHHNPARRPSKPMSQFRGPSLVHSHSHSMAASMPPNASPFTAYHTATAAKTEAVYDGPALASLPETDKANSQSRMRRASEGASRLAKADGKRTSGSDLRCEKCGKGYKHSSCLTKHLSVVPRALSAYILSPLKTNALHCLSVEPR